MKQHYTTVVGLDVHKASIAVAVLPSDAERPTEEFVIENNPKTLEKTVKRITARSAAEFVYEAGPCGYQVQRLVSKMGHRCAVIAPGLIPVRPTDRVKTDRRDAAKLARLFRAGELTEIRIPTGEEEAARDLVRTREDGLADRLRARHRLSKFLLRQGRTFGATKSWGVNHRIWLKGQRFEWEPSQRSFEAYMRTLDDVDARMATLDQQVLDLALREPYQTPARYLCCLKGINTLSAITLLVETQDFRRFAGAAQYMGFTGLVSSEWSSSDKIRRGKITKAGNTHIRRILVEAAWSNRNNNVVSYQLARRREGCPAEVVRIAKQAQVRLRRKYWRLVGKSKPHNVTVAAVARELAGFVWSISRHFPSGASLN